jgi:hypothetical protein
MLGADDSRVYDLARARLANSILSASLKTSTLLSSSEQSASATDSLPAAGVI